MISALALMELPGGLCWWHSASQQRSMLSNTTPDATNRGVSQAGAGTVMKISKTGGRDGRTRGSGEEGYVRLLGRSLKNNPSFVRGVKIGRNRFQLRGYSIR